MIAALPAVQTKILNVRDGDVFEEFGAPPAAYDHERGERMIREAAQDFARFVLEVNEFWPRCDIYQRAIEIEKYRYASVLADLCGDIVPSLQ